MRDHHSYITWCHNLPLIAISALTQLPSYCAELTAYCTVYNFSLICASLTFMTRIKGEKKMKSHDAYSF